jgi:hypothetical protein
MEAHRELLSAVIDKCPPDETHAVNLSGCGDSFSRSSVSRCASQIRAVSCPEARATTCELECFQPDGAVAGTGSPGPIGSDGRP